MSPRLAWFSPWPPERGPAARRSSDVVPLVAASGFGVDVFVDESAVHASRTAPRTPVAPGEMRVLGAHEFIWRQAQHPYALNVYPLGYARTPLYDFLWPYIFRWPGLVWLHDGRLHEARARTLARRRQVERLRAAIASGYPLDQQIIPPAAAEGEAAWSFLDGVMRTSRLVAVTSPYVRTELGLDWPNVEMACITPGVAPAAPVDRVAIRRALNLSPEAVVFGVVGPLGADARLPQILRAFAAAQARRPRAHLLIAGRVDPRIASSVREAMPVGLESAIHSVDDLAVAHAIAASDVVVSLTWPSAGGISDTWLDALAAGRATITTDATHLATIPALDPRTWRRHTPIPDQSPDAEQRAIAVAIDMLDEEHSLRLAFMGLAGDEALRQRLATTAATYWSRHHTLDHMRDDVLRAVSRAMGRPAPEMTLPALVRPDALQPTRAKLDPFGVSLPF